MKEQLTIGLFGTCGESKWRNQFIEAYDNLNINYFNPLIDNWTPERAEIEAEHLAKDQIILFPVTSETYGLGSLSEIGFSILNAIKLEEKRDFIVLIDDTLDNNLTDESLRKESLRARKLVKEHLKKINFENVYIVKTLDEMFSVSKILYTSNKLKLLAKKNCDEK